MQLLEVFCSSFNEILSRMLIHSLLLRQQQFYHSWAQTRLPYQKTDLSGLPSSQEVPCQRSSPSAVVKIRTPNPLLEQLCRRTLVAYLPPHQIARRHPTRSAHTPYLYQRLFLLECQLTATDLECTTSHFPQVRTLASLHQKHNNGGLHLDQWVFTLLPMAIRRT